MKYVVECYENERLFRGDPGAPVIMTEDPAVVRWITESPLKLVATLEVEADSPIGAAEVAFDIGNAPWNPADLDGRHWPHHAARSMSSGDVVAVRTPDGTPRYACLSWSWAALPVGVPT